MKQKLIKMSSISFIGLGIFLTMSAAFPIFKYEVFTSRGFVQEQDFISPLKKVGIVAGAEDPYPLNLLHASNWFVGAPDLPEVASSVHYYNLSIPKLRIENAVVKIAGDDLAEHLIQFKGTALPGRQGNTVIFGHSTLPQLYNPENYLTIFTHLTDLKKGDKISIDYDGITYKYAVEDLLEVKPEDIQILEQRYDGSYLTLITCVPPGTFISRLVVRARIIPEGDGNI